MKYWKKLSQKDINTRIDKALSATIDFQEKKYLGYPVSKLDEKVFEDKIAISNSPLLKAYIANPNNIGCHTIGESEEAFKGSQELEKEVLNILAVDVFKCEENSFDGYIATGGTESNIQALWIYRNYYENHFDATPNEIVILASEDTHYSIPKGSNLLNIDLVSIPVDFDSRNIDENELNAIVSNQKNKGKKYFIIISNMATTMFGSVDDPDLYAAILNKQQVEYKIHIDGAFGGFIYPFNGLKSSINFSNKNISSITIDAHKMLQAPYGTGVFLCRKGLIENVLTKEAQYVSGMDLTLVGSRSGANAMAVWLILVAYGPYGWYEKISVLLMRTNWLCKQLDNLSIKYYRHPGMNIVTLNAKYVTTEIAHKFGLVPDSHEIGKANWYKIIIMDHVEIDNLMNLIDALTPDL